MVADQLEEMYGEMYFSWRKNAEKATTELFTELGIFEGANSTTQVIFSTNPAAISNITIPTGTRVQTGTNIIFETTQDGIISIGNIDSSPIPAAAVNAGTDSNISALSITSVVNIIQGVISVRNEIGSTGGSDGETEQEFFFRVQDYLKSLDRSTIAAVKFLSLNVSGVKSVSVIENDPTPGTVQIIIDDGIGQPSIQLLQQVALNLEGDGTNDNPGVRPPGVKFNVIKPVLITVNLELNVTYLDGSNPSLVNIEIINNLTNYTDNLPIGEDVVYSELIFVIQSVNGVRSTFINNLLNNIDVDLKEVAKLGVVTINP